MKIDPSVQYDVEQHENRAGRSASGKTVGVVFVHGIGEQLESETVREFGGALLGWLQEWYKARDLDVAVTTSSLSYGEEGTRPARFTISLPEWTDPRDAHAKPRPAETWILAEAWWASRLTPPGFVTLVTWGWKVLWDMVTQLFDNALHRYLQPTTPPRPGLVRFVGGLSAILLMFGLALAVLDGYPLIALLFVLAQIPISQVQDFILFKTLRVFLLSRIGDFYTFMYDDVQAVHIRETVPYAIKYLLSKSKCDEVVVVAHSQGTVVAFDALSSGAVKETDKIRTLVTFGTALRTAWRFAPPRTTRLASDLPTDIRWVDFWSAYDNVSGRKTEPPAPLRGPDESIEVTNSMNILTDHGGYFTNSEEFLSRLAQEIDPQNDRPTDDRTYRTSRFWTADTPTWVTRRQDRVLTMVGWRVATIIGVFAALVVRMLDADRLRQDGEAVWAGLSGVVIAGDALKWIDQALGWVAPLEPGLARLLAIGVWAGVLTFFFNQLVRFLFGNWQTRESDRSTGPTPPSAGVTQERQIRVRSVAAIAFISASALMLAGAPVLGSCAAPSSCGWAFFGVALGLFIAIAGTVDEVLGNGDTEVRPSEVWRREVLWWLASVLGIFALLSVVLGPYAVATEMAGTTLPEQRFLAPPQVVYDIVAGLDAAARRTYHAALWFDFASPVLYVLALGGIAWMLVKKDIVPLVAMIALVAVVLAGVFDIVENIALLQLLDVSTRPDWIGLVPLLTSLKFGFLGVMLLAALAIALFRVLASAFGGPDPAPASTAPGG